MKTVLTLALLTCLPFTLAAPDPCRLLAPREVKAGLGAPAVSAAPATDQDIPTCNYDFEGGAFSLGVTAGAAKVLGGKPLLSVLQSGGDDGTPMKGVKAVPGLGDEAAGSSEASVDSGASSDLIMLYVRKGDTLLVFTALASNHAASRVTLQDLTLLARRALLRLH